MQGRRQVGTQSLNQKRVEYRSELSYESTLLVVRRSFFSTDPQGQYVHKLTICAQRP